MQSIRLFTVGAPRLPCGIPRGSPIPQGLLAGRRAGIRNVLRSKREYISQQSLSADQKVLRTFTTCFSLLTQSLDNKCILILHREILNFRYAGNKSLPGNSYYKYYREHTPAHFHAEYGEYTITVEIESGVVQGKFPRRALNAVLEWYELHQEELMQNWNLAMDKKALNKIEPLE